MSTEPLIHMNKCDVVAQRLANYVIMPKGSDQSFAQWWQSLPDTTSVEVCYHISIMGMPGDLPIHLNLQ